ncbi:MAG: hypothetical protein GY860_21610 [Desulfobacteraceae bacterium]|nr:hypothetical protein [Desulfobacteraceae bacterium]
MNHISQAIGAVFILALISACSPYTGDRLLRLSEQSRTYNQSSIISKVKGSMSDILDSLGVPEETKASFEKIAPENIICANESLKLTHVGNQLVVAGANTNISFATNSIIISTGALHISHSANNFIVCGSDVDISHDGSMGNGSLVISKGKTKISHAGNTIIYAIKGVEVSHAHNVKSFNTLERKTSWGNINNVIVEPLFHEETAPNTYEPPSSQ